MVDSDLESSPAQGCVHTSFETGEVNQREVGAGAWAWCGQWKCQRQKHRARNVKRKMLTVRFAIKKDSDPWQDYRAAAETCTCPRFSSLLILSSSDYNLAFSVYLRTGKYSMFIRETTVTVAFFPL